MARFGKIEFPEPVLSALAGDSLVVFAGAGVSMGPPSSLPSFEQLSRRIAGGIEPTKPLDRFLGMQVHRGVHVHERAAEFVSPRDSQPNDLHRYLLGLFRRAEDVRLVTTNFDSHFESAAHDVFGRCPDLYDAPALPLGYRFRGLVYIHGSVRRPDGLVVTDSDFGRAYLTEGWARRFLVDLFEKFTVMFVGYSHTDPAMTYLARALPPHRLAGRFALVERSEDPATWQLLGIEPIAFEREESSRPFSCLYDGVRILGEFTQRGLLEWRERIAVIADAGPPNDQETVHEVEYLLKARHTTAALLDVVRGPLWATWFFERHHLRRLFTSEDLGEIDLQFAGWVAAVLAEECPQTLFWMIARSRQGLHPHLWLLLFHAVESQRVAHQGDDTLARWASLLVANPPVNVDQYLLARLCSFCMRVDLPHLGLRVFAKMTEYVGQLRHTSGGSASTQDQARLTWVHALSAELRLIVEVWNAHVRPLLDRFAVELLSLATDRFHAAYLDASIWNGPVQASRELDRMRVAVEPHEQEHYSDGLSLLVDIAREALASLASTQRAAFDAWLAKHEASEVPILRRLVTHSVGAYSGLTADERLVWLLLRKDLYSHLEYHEIRRLAVVAFASASEHARERFVQKILAGPPSSAPGFPRPARERRVFDWLVLLEEHRPDCQYTAAGLNPIKNKYPEWRPGRYRDLTSWIEGPTDVLPRSPWSIEELLGTAPLDQLERLVAFADDGFDKPSRYGLLCECRKAAGECVEWGLDLLRALVARELWASDLWEHVLVGVMDSDPPSEQVQLLLELVSDSRILPQQKKVLGHLLVSLVSRQPAPGDAGLFELANVIAARLAEHALSQAEVSSDPIQPDQWLNRAYNEVIGLVCRFWAETIRHGLESDLRWFARFREYHREQLTKLVRPLSQSAGLGRAVLAGYAQILYSWDVDWAKENVIPWFADLDPCVFAQAWDGFLFSGGMQAALGADLLPTFVSATARVWYALPSRRGRVIEHLAGLAVHVSPDPREGLLAVFLSVASPDDRRLFAMRFGSRLRQVSTDKRASLWEKWLHSYWRDRVQGVPFPLAPVEVGQMVGWLAYLGNAYPEAVDLVCASSEVTFVNPDVLVDLINSDMPATFPEDTARLLIHLVQFSASRDVGLAPLARRLGEIRRDVYSEMVDAFARSGIRLS